MVGLSLYEVRPELSLVGMSRTDRIFLSVVNAVGRAASRVRTVLALFH